MKASARIKRVYDAPSRTDGVRVLVDRLWPRGVSKESAALTLWLKEVAPSPALRKWFDHDPERWVEFRKRYRAELRANPVAVEVLRDILKSRRVTLLYSAHDTEHNQARVLVEYLNGKPQPARRVKPARTARS